MLGAKPQNYDAYGLLRTMCSHNFRNTLCEFHKLQSLLPTDEQAHVGERPFASDIIN